MKILLTGVSCVGKTTIGSQLAKKLNYPFFNLDVEAEIRNKKSIEQMQSEYLSRETYRKEIYCPILKNVLTSKSNNMIIELPPSGLRGSLYKIVKEINDGVTIALQDKPENILKRITFYDFDSKKIDKKLTQTEEKLYLREIKLNNTFFNKYYKKASHRLNISGLTVGECVNEIISLLKL